MATHCNGNDDGNDGNELQRWNFLATMEFFGNALQRWKRFATCKQWIVARANTPLDKTQKSHTHNPSLTLYLASKKILKQFLFYDED